MSTRTRGQVHKLPSPNWKVYCYLTVSNGHYTLTENLKNSTLHRIAVARLMYLVLRVRSRATPGFFFVEGGVERGRVLGGKEMRRRVVRTKFYVIW